MPDKAHLETARIVLALDTAIAAFRAGESSGVRALDSASRLLDDLVDDAVSKHAGRADGHRHVPRRPDRVELAILTALADTYGAEMLTNASLGYALRLRPAWWRHVRAARAVGRVGIGCATFRNAHGRPGRVHADLARVYRRLSSRGKRGDRRLHATATRAADSEKRW
jgi:hypothetical protein